jgi:hypothetical protein
MGLVSGFPPRAPSGRRSIRYYNSGTTQGSAFTDTGNSFLFIDGTGANPYQPLPKITRPDEIEPPNALAVPPAPWGSGLSDQVAGVARAASITASNSESYAFLAGDTLVLAVDGGSNQTVTWDAAPAEVTDTTTYPVTAGTGVLTVAIDRGAGQPITFAGTETTPAQIAATIDAQITGASAAAVGGQVVITSDTEGTGSYVEVTANPSANPLLTFPTSEVQGTGDVADISSVSAAEVVSRINDDTVGISAEVLGTTVRILSNSKGASASIKIDATSDVEVILGLDTVIHYGVAGVPEGPLPLIWSTSILIDNTGAHDLEFSFDGTNVHGIVLAGASKTYLDRCEAGIAVRGVGGSTTYVIEAW